MGVLRTLSGMYLNILIVIVVFLFGGLLFLEIAGKTQASKPLPYRKRDDFLSRAEKMFYCTMKTFIDGSAVICPKVGVKELIFVGKGQGKNYSTYFNRIARKHVDFVLCRPDDMQTLCAIELDDSSHARADRKKRDEFVDKVFEAARIPLFHMPLKSGYTIQDFEGIMNLVHMSVPAVGQTANSEQATEPLSDALLQIPTCPKCGIEMVKRKASRGSNAGNEFYGCPNYPRCKEVKATASAISNGEV